MKRHLLTCIALCSAMLGAMAQRSYTFNAVALNVDGLPNSISGIEINPDGKEADGATELCGILANSGWDIVGFSEDFNFHDELTAAPASTYYYFGEPGGSVDASAILGGASTDGLGFACAKYLTMGGGTRVEWGNYNGFTDQGADGLVTKGFRVYTVTFTTGVAVDVYVLHMDAEDGEKDIAARKTQLGTLATYIKNNHNNRPVIILGDTNCRYTRDELKTAFIDVINADSRFTIKDAWVELMWGGAYPTYGAGSMMTDAYGMQKGEIVDKVFYINTTESNLTLKANSYLHDESVTVSDHKPVVVNFTLTDPNGTAPTEEDFTIDATGGTNAPTHAGNQVENNTTYFVKNVATGQYLKSGADYGTRAIAGSAGMAITFKSSNSNWKLYTTSTLGVMAQSDPYMDGTPGEWTLEQVAGSTYQYYIKCGAGTLSTSDDKLGRVYCVEHNANDNKQKWVLLTEAQMKSEMTKGSGQYPYDVTPLVRAADFDRMDDEQGFYSYWSGADENTIGGIWWEGPEKYNGCGAIVNTTRATTLSQTISGMPAGYYKVSFEGFYRSIRSGSDRTATARLTVGGKTFNLAQNKNTTISTDRLVPGQVFRDNDTYMQEGTFQLTSSTNNITFQIYNGSTTGNNWVCFDNIKLVYSADGFSDPYLEHKNTVINKVNSTYPKVLELNEAGQAAYDISTVIYRYKNNLITSAAIATALCEIVDKAYANAYAAHLAYNVSQVIANMGANGGDITGAIINPSFETGDVTGWTIAGGGGDVGVKLNSNGTYTAEGCDGDYLFNSYGGDDGHTAYVRQTIKGIPNGLYELKAKVTSFGIIGDNKTHDYHIYLTGNSYHTSVAADQGKTVFKEATLYFLVEDGTATIGAIGGNKGGGTEFIHYWADQGCFFKADDFRLKYICDVPHGRLKLALDEANATKLDGFGQIALDLSSYQAAYDNKSLTTDGKAEVAAIYDALQVAAKAQKTAGADMTWAIENPNFETGDYTGWNVTVQWDTRVGTQESDIKVAGADGRYFFNTWNNANGTNNTNEHITQTVTGIPNGTYRLTAMLATDNGASLELTGNGETTPIAASTNGNSSGVFPTVECTVTDNTLTIEAGGAGGAWYKADNFRLTLVEPAETPELVFNHTATTITAIEDITFPRVVLQRPIKAKDSKGNPAWSSFVAPFDIPAFGGWDYMKLSGATYKESSGNISLQFTNVETIEAGVPYMVRCTTMTETLPQIEMGETSVNTVTKKDTKVNITDGNGSTVTFKGVYTAGNVPQGAFFISDNTFYQAADGTNTLKGFRGYIQIEGSLASKARSMSFRWDDGTTSIDNGQLTNDNEVTTVAIYNEKGIRLTEMQQGINILLMSDGTTVKVVIR